MLPKITHIAEAIRLAREQKGLSQRALCGKVGLTQAHISKIENASIDLRLSNLIEVARALDLEPMLIPRVAVNTVKGLKTSTPHRTDGKQPPPAYWLDEDQDDG